MYTPPAIKQFATQSDAQREAESMQGWGKPSVVIWKADPYVPDSKEAFVIRVPGGQYMYDDGYVR